MTADAVTVRFTDKVRPALTTPLPGTQLAALLRGLLPMRGRQEAEEAQPAA